MFVVLSYNVGGRGGRGGFTPRGRGRGGGFGSGRGKNPQYQASL